ncbi:MAG TPA: helix-turn-helix transcriptional regulator [Pirellulales bacterium]|jgi:transcriptional regulator with XRE-family HTH domain|nr:helix-turn-helix transcriptional regulator [Pirellulales bacterium]
MPDYASNLHRLMARLNLTVRDVAQRTGLDQRTIKGLLRGNQPKPHARTLHQLAAGLGVDVNELFQTPSLLAHRAFDRATNPVVDDYLAQHPEAVEGWSEGEFDELYSHVGTGGGLTLEGASRMIDAINLKRDTWRKMAVVFESGEAKLLSDIIALFYDRVVFKH